MAPAERGRLPSILLLIALAAALLAAPIALGRAGATTHPSAAANGRIVFSSDRDGNYEIYSMEPDGSDVRRLTNTSAPECCPSSSPDASKVAFVSYRDGNNELYVADADGGNQTRLTYNNAFDWSPKWSPDGQSLAFQSDRDGNFEIYRMNSDGSGVLRLTNAPGGDGSPAWSPDGTKIAFSGTREGRAYPDILVMRSDGNDVTRLTTNTGLDGDPTWSSDGTTIAYAATREPPPPPPPPPMPPTPDDYPDIFTIPSTGGDRTRLTYNYRSDFSPDWSPDGAKITFTAYALGVDVFVMDADGTNQVNLTQNPFNLSARDPDWAALPPPPPPPPPPPGPPLPPPPPPPGPPPPPPPPPPAPTTRCVVPRVIGMRLLAARRTIRRAHCSLGRVRKARSRRNRVGRVLSQSPRPRAVRTAGWRVSVVVGRR
jgi:Tol biopolymer transport system component